MSAEQFTTAGEALTCQGCGGTILANTGMYFVQGSPDEGEDSWACSPECGRVAGLRRAIERIADRLDALVMPIDHVARKGLLVMRPARE